MQKDRQFVTEVLAGRREAYCELVMRHERAVRAVAWSVLGDHHASEDVAQEAFLTAYEKLRGLRRRDAFCAWVCRIAHRQAVRAARRRRKRPASLPEQPLTAADKDPPDEQHDLMRAILTMPERLRTLVLMTYFEQRSAAEIARIQDCPIGTVTKLLSRARGRLRKRLQERQP